MTNRELYERASRLMPGGVNSPVRAFGSVGGEPPFLVRAEGAYVEDADGARYLDLCGSWGPMILGHACPAVVEAVRETAPRGLSFGACHEKEILLAEAIQARMPHLERLRLVSSGTEAAMSAVRLARAATGREGILKFEGCYHGHADSFLIAAGSGLMTFGAPSSPGVTSGAAGDTLLARYNDLESVEACLEEHADHIACIIVEPVAGNMGVIPPAEDFLEGLRALCDAHGALLIFDEVITGFRVAPGGAAARYGVTPDLAILGKIIGGGLPVGAFGGRADLMDQMAPLGPVYQAGTLSGNPIACAAGLATLGALEADPPYERLETLGARLEAGLRDALASDPLGPWCINRVGSMGTLFLGVPRVSNYDEAGAAATARFGRYHGAMLRRGIYLPPSQFEAFFLSAAHGEAEVDRIVAAHAEAVGELLADGPAERSDR